MALDDRTANAVGFLLGLADEGVADRVRSRLGLDAGRAAGEGVIDNRFRTEVREAPAQVRLWLLRADDPEVNATLFAMGLLPPGLARDVVAGVPFGPGDPDRRVERSLNIRTVSPTDERLGEGLFLPRILNRLYDAESGGLRRARRAVLEVRSAYWPGIAAAHAQRPLPGYARWALAERFDCPPELRAAFGSHPKFTHRLRKAGIVDGLEDLVTGIAPAISALPLLAVLHRAQPAVVEESAAAVRPLVAERLGGHVEAWAVLAQLLPEFVGTTEELVELAAAIAGPEPETGTGAWADAARPRIADTPERPARPEHTPAPAKPAASAAPAMSAAPTASAAPAVSASSGTSSASAVPSVGAASTGSGEPAVRRSWFGRVARGLRGAGQ